MALIPPTITKTKDLKVGDVITFRAKFNSVSTRNSQPTLNAPYVVTFAGNVNQRDELRQENWPGFEIRAEKIDYDPQTMAWMPLDKVLIFYTPTSSMNPGVEEVVVHGTLVKQVRWIP